MIDPHLVFLKTEKGEAEFSTRAYKLNHALRYVLILVNGKSTVDEIRSKGAGLPNVDETLSQLAELGFIHPQSASKPRSSVFANNPKGELIALAHEILGTQAAAVIKKLNASEETPQALAETATTCMFETGHPWITFKDPCNLRSPQQHVGVVHSSNLCTEITPHRRPRLPA